MRDLRRYRSKRAPELTPEPFGEDGSARHLPPGAPRRFVVQQHAARRLHWDLRLEIEGVLVSWAVPRGPSLDPAEKRLAVQTEDHPLAYADFEGVIPAGNYGAGAMIVWDQGTWRAADGVDPAVGLEQGKLDLWLAGEKLRGRFALVRTRRGEGRDWLLIAKGRAPAGPELVEAEPASVLSGLTVEELRDGVTRDAAVAQAARSAGAPRRCVDPAALRPMLATASGEPFSREGWLFELKYDGVRVVASRDASGARIFARAGGERTALYPEVAAALAHLPLGECVIDGEIVVLDAWGRSSFERLQRRFTQTDPAVAARLAVEVPATLLVFDCLAAEGHDLRGLPLTERKRILALFAPRRGPVRFADHVEGDGLALFDAARQHGLEGVVAKRADSVYETGRRAKSWLKVKVPRSATLAIVGVVPGRGSRSGLGSLMLAGRRGDRFVYAGSAGSGLGGASIAELLPALEAARRETPPCQDVPDTLPRGSWFAEPRRACEVRFTEVTEAGLLRHPVFVALRDDVDPLECEAPRARGEPAVPAEAERATGRRGDAAPVARPEPELALTRLDKVFWPVEGYTKGDLLAYYEAVWSWLAPYLRDRPVVLTRYPDGIEGKYFYQKNAPEFTPDWATRETLDGTDYFVCNDLRTLLYVINSGAIPLHVSSARLGALDRPDWLILDLDPKDAPFAHVVEIARHLHALLRELGATHAVKTSGQDGLHVLLPLGARLDHDETRALAEALARTVAAELPEIATVTRPVAARGRRVYVDFLQNGRGKLIAAPLSVRPRPGAPVSMPLTWSQVTSKLDPSRFTIRTAPAALARRGDPFAAVLGPGVDLEGLLAALAERLAKAPAGGGKGRRARSEPARRGGGR